MNIRNLKKNFIIFPLTSHIIEHGTFNYIFDNPFLKGFLKFNELLIGTYFRGVPIIGEEEISENIELILLEKDNEYIIDNLHDFEKYGKEIMFFDLEGNLYTKNSLYPENIEKNDKPIISFILFFDYYTLSRISIELKDYYRIAFIPTTRKDMQIDEKYFDKVIYFDEDKKLYEFLDYINPKIIFTKALIGHYFRVSNLVDRYSNVIVDSTDIPQFFHEDEAKCKFFFGGDSEFISVENIAKKAKKFLVRYSDEELDYLNRFSENKNIQTWYEYTNEKFYSFNNKKLNKTYSLVWAGILAPLSYPNYFIGKDLLNSAKTVSKQSMKFTFMLPPSYSSSMIMVESDRKLYYEYFYIARFDDNITIHFGDIPQRAIKLLENFDFGVFPLFQDDNWKFTKHMIPSKFALYLEAGLPIIVNENMETLAGIVREYEIGIVVNNDTAKDLKCIIDQNVEKYTLMKKNVFSFRQNFNYKKEVEKLLKDLGIQG